MLVRLDSINLYYDTLLDDFRTANNVMTMTNTLKAIINIVDNPSYQLMQKYQGRNRINGIGDALERFIRDIVIPNKNQAILK